MHSKPDVIAPYPSTHVYYQLGVLDRLTTALAAVPAVCFTGAFLTDLTYASAPDMQWTNFSAWLLAFGMLFACLAALSGIIAYFSGPRPALNVNSWLFVAAIALTLTTAFFNNLVHSRDAWTSVVPSGLMLSALTVILMIAAAFFHYRNVSLAYRENVS